VAASRRSRASASATAVARTQKLSSVPVDRYRYQQNRDNPQNDVFAAAFFLGHRRQYTTPEISVQVPIGFSPQPLKDPQNNSPIPRITP
jgi:hypothetical protein